VPYAARDAGAVEVGAERGVVALALLRRPLDLLRAAIVSGVRVDRDQLGTCGRRHRQHDRRPSPVAADLDDARGRA
jgi:hypothetical protein